MWIGWCDDSASSSTFDRRINMNDRKAARKALATLLETITTFEAVYDHESLDLAGLSPVAMVHSDGTAPGPGVALDTTMRQHAFLISILWARGDNTEDDIDDLSAQVFALLEANQGPTADWGSLSIDDNFSGLDYPIANGVMHRREQIRVIIW
jgi:hypothetical protein